ncbi:extracellular catalytic domain type 1 short-chain-length polyhydroxyalkanoate depolymerase [Microbispora sp. CA-135349]|uniref:extracellular catalytic domain type 1 short-chain-length polyhydroxyalkanoate depolymerase n=1 Tax=Microbispora sp. CA-135349 TaxID=3239953 RepID=UPI003D8E7634
MASRFRALAALFAALVLALTTLVGNAVPASAATLQEITNFGTNPTNLKMYLYVPNNVPAHPAILVGVHWCHGTGRDFYSGTQFASLADRYGFIVVYPSASSSDGCWDVHSQAALTHNGGSDPLGIVSMVRYVEQHNGGDPNRVYVTGHSSGGMMTNVLLGSYPDVFKAGAAFAGVPFGCFAGSDSWSTACATGTITKNPQQWGDLVRNAYPGYTGPRPRMQLWHGTNDDVLYFHNFEEEIKQWTDVLGVSQTPTSTEYNIPRSTWTRTRYGSQVEAIKEQGQPHNLQILADEVVHFFGLDGSAPTPSPSASPTRSPSPTPSPSPSPTRSPSPSPSSPDGPCRVAYTMNAWNTGFTADVTISNTGTSTINSWSLTFTLPSGQTVISAWNAAISPSSGQVTAKNAAYNGTIAPGASTSFGFQAGHNGNTGKPSSFSLNGANCAVA